MDVQRILREGLMAGLIGAAAIALWFLVVDTIAREPFYTPSMLGSALFWGLRDPAQVVVSAPAVAGYTLVHTMTFLIVGTIAAAFACQAERIPSVLFLAAVGFAAFEFGFYIVLVVWAQPLLGAVAWWSVAVGNAIAAGGMSYYLWRAHPQLREKLAAHPLGAAIDESADSIRRIAQ
jgi:hypothetical protein